MISFQGLDNFDVASVTGSMDQLELDSVTSGAVIVPDDLVPPNANDVYNNYSFAHEYDEKLPITPFRQRVSILSKVACVYTPWQG